MVYESAHIDGVESEKVVRAGHPTQAHPEMIEEVRRILREHLGAGSVVSDGKDSTVNGKAK